VSGWQTRHISDLIDGLTAGVSVRSVGGVGFGPAVLKTSAVDRGRFEPIEVKTILAADRGRARCNPLAGSLIISRMNTPAMVGDVGYVDKTYPDLYLPDRLWLARSKRGSGTDMRWLTYFFASEPGAALLHGLASGTSVSMQSIPKDRVLSLEIAVPDADEQRAIGDALEDVERLIRTLERLVAKKQEIKQGMMQELLTGKSRLVGFTGKWRTATADEIGAFKGGSGFPLRYQGSAAGKYPFYKVSDMNLAGNGRVLRIANNYISQFQRKQIGAVVMPRHAIVFAKVGAAIFQERKRLLEQPSCIDNNMAALVLDPGVADPHFVRYALTNISMGALVATTALPSLNAGQLRSITLALPPTVVEQRAIASALLDADAELDALARRVTKARAIKRGMMQQLLTGRVRLPAGATT
jgi:type I restriction enzyme S subunit